MTDQIHNSPELDPRYRESLAEKLADLARFEREGRILGVRISFREGVRDGDVQPADIIDKIRDILKASMASSARWDDIPVAEYQPQ